MWTACGYELVPVEETDAEGFLNCRSVEPHKVWVDCLAERVSNKSRLCGVGFGHSTHPDRILCEGYSLIGTLLNNTGS